MAYVLQDIHRIVDPELVLVHAHVLRPRQLQYLLLHLVARASPAASNTRVRAALAASIGRICSSFLSFAS